MLEKMFRISEAVCERIEKRKILRAAAQEYADAEVDNCVSEKGVMLDRCRGGKQGIVFTCHESAFQCLKGTSGSEHGCNVNTYSFCPTLPVQCVGRDFACTGTAAYECASFECGLPASTNQNTFECTASELFACNGTIQYDCINNFKCTGGDPGFSCTTKHNCLNSHGCGKTPPAGDSFGCGVGTSNKDQYNCAGDFDCNSGTQGSNTGFFQCAASANFVCGQFGSTGNSGDFDCASDFVCANSGGFDCESSYDCSSNVNCIAPFGGGGS